MKSWNSNIRFDNLLQKNKEIKKYLTRLELKKLLIEEDKIENIDWIFKNKVK